MEEKWKKVNPVLPLDYPDPDVIRVDDTYYMVSTTMHFMPGCVILRSYNLADWEIYSYVYETLELTDQEYLKNGKNAYGQGMWAATLRYEKGMFYLIFVANDTGKTYLFRAPDLKGPWQKNEIEGFYHDCSLLFDEGRAFLAYGNRQIYVMELNEEMTAPKEGGLHKLLVEDLDEVYLGYEGTHWYKINGKYYLFFIHYRKGDNTRRSQACYVSDSLAGPYTGGEVLDTDGGYCNQGVAQGGIVSTTSGKWYAMLFRDSGAVGRLPVLVPVHFENDFPVFGVDGKVEDKLLLEDTKPTHKYAPLYGDEDFSSLHNYWQWNHVPDDSRWKLLNHRLILQTGKICNNVTQAPNTLTQRMPYPGGVVTVTVDGSALSDGDIAGLCMLQSDYALAGITKENGKYFLVKLAKDGVADGQMNPKEDDSMPAVQEKIPLSSAKVTLRAKIDFTRMKDKAVFEWKQDGNWQILAEPFSLYFKLDHFCGVRPGLFCYATKEHGGQAAFSDFTMRKEETDE